MQDSAPNATPIVTPHDCDPPKEGRLEGSAYELGLQYKEYMSPTLEMSCQVPWA